MLCAGCKNINSMRKFYDFVAFSCNIWGASVTGDFKVPQDVSSRGGRSYKDLWKVSRYLKP